MTLPTRPRSVLTSTLRAVVLGVLTVTCLGPVARPAVAQCDAPIAPGAWNGTFQLNEEAQLPGLQTTWTWKNTGTLDLVVACGGDVTGSLTLNQIANVVQPSGNSTCTSLGLNIQVAGTVTWSDSNLPVLNLPGTLAAPGSATCTGGVVGAGLTLAGAVGLPIGLRFTASSSAPGLVTGQQMVWTAPPEWLRFFQIIETRGGRPIVRSAQWQITGGATATPEPDAPVITRLTAKYSQYFLQGVASVPNEYTAEVDWKNGTPGPVTFSLAGQPPQSDASTPYTFQQEMSSLPGSAVLNVVAVNQEGKSSAIKSMAVNVAALPECAQGLPWSVELQNGYVLYKTRQDIPPQPWQKGYVQVDDRIPYYGGPYGILPFQLKINLTVDSRGGQAKDQVSGTGGAAWGRDTQAGLTFSGDTFTSLTANQLAFDRGQADVRFDPFSYEKYYGLFDLIPGSRQYLSLPFVGRIIQALNELLSVGGRANGSLSGQGRLGINGANRLDVTQGNITLSASVVIDILRLGIRAAYVAVGGGGRGSLDVRFTPDWGLGGCTVSLFLRAEAYAFGYRAERRSAPYTYVCTPSSSMAAPDGQLAAPLGWSLRVPARTPGWAPEQPSTRVSAGAGLTTTVLVENASPNASPALALGPGGQMALAWVAEDPALPRPQASEIRLRLFDGQAWGQTIAVTHDTRPDFNPQVAFDGAGRAVVVWTQNQIEDLSPDSALDERFLRNLEVVYAVVEPKTGALTASGRLTNDQALDFDVRLSAAHDGTLWVAWQSSPQAISVGDAQAPNQLKAAVWDGQKWSPLETITSQLTGTLWWSLAAYDKSRAGLAADQVAGSAFDDAAQREIVMFERAAGGWSPPRVITHNSSADLAPRLALTPDGQFVLAWYNTGKIIGVSGDLAAPPSAWFTATAGMAAGMSAGTLLAGPRGDLALLWTGPTPTGAVLNLAKFDAATRTWAAPQAILPGEAQQEDVTASLRSNGDLVLGFSQTAAVTETAATAPDGQPVVVPALADSASLVVAELPGVFGSAPVAAPAASRLIGPLALAGLGCVALLGLAGLGLVLLRLRPWARPKSQRTKS